uniref:Uncharacterized protein n=1 Tax=viral metagenome TaxID=1070528 RepID=A0A6C0D0L0_9ZZZZ
MSNSTQAPFFSVKVGTLNSNTSGIKTDGSDTVQCYVSTQTVPLSINSTSYSDIYPSNMFNLNCSYNNTSVSGTNPMNVSCIPSNSTAPPVTDTSLAYCITPKFTTSGDDKSISCSYITAPGTSSSSLNC